MLGTRVGLGRLFSSLEGSIHSLCSGWDGALPGGCCSLSRQPGEVPHGVVEGSLGNLTAQPHWVCSDLFWTRCVCTSSLMAYLGPSGTPDLLTGPRVTFLACAALTAQHPGHPAPLPSGLQGGLGAPGSLAAQMPLHAPCPLSSWHICPHGAGALQRCSGSPSALRGSREPQGGPACPKAALHGMGCSVLPYTRLCSPCSSPDTLPGRQR